MSTPQPVPAGQLKPSATANIYDFAQPEIKVDLAVGKAGAFIRHILRKPLLPDYGAYFVSAKRVSRNVAKFEWVNKSDETKAKTDLYDALILRAELHPSDKTKEVRHLTKAQILGYDDDGNPTGDTPVKFEEKKAVVDVGLQLGSPDFEVLENENADEFATIFDTEDVIRVRQRIGNSDKPDYTIIYSVTSPSAGARQAFGGSVQTKERFEKKNKDLEISINIEQGPKQFSRVFSSVENGAVNGEPFAEDKKAAFLKEIDPWFQYCVMDRVVASFDRARDSQ